MRFELGHKRCCISKLLRGEAKRVPRNPLQKPVGFYVGCPRCGRPQTITTSTIDPIAGQTVTEDGPMGEIVTMGPGYTCDVCGVRFSVRAGEIEIHGS